MALLRALLIAAIALGMARPAAASTTAEATAHLDGAIDGFAGVAAVVVSDPTTGFRYARNDDVEFISASLYKLGVLVEAYRQQAAGAISLDETWIAIGWEDLDWESGWYVAPGTEMTVREALDWTITLSDNETANALLRLLDPHAVNDAFASLGMPRTRLNWVLPEDERTAEWNITTARDMETLFTLLLAGRVVSPAASREMLDLLSRQQVNDRLPAGLPAGTTVAHKTGNLWDVAHDAGVVYTPWGPRVSVVMTAHYERYEDVVGLAALVAAETYGLVTGRFGASVTPLAPAGVEIRAGTPFFGTVRVTNTGERRFAAATLRLRWLGAAGTLVHEAPAVAVPALAPGATAILVVRDVAPAAGRYRLELSVGDSGSTSAVSVVAADVAP